MGEFRALKSEAAYLAWSLFFFFFFLNLARPFTAAGMQACSSLQEWRILGAVVPDIRNYQPAVDPTVISVRLNGK